MTEPVLPIREVRKRPAASPCKYKLAFPHTRGKRKYADHEYPRVVDETEPITGSQFKGRRPTRRPPKNINI